MATAVETSTRKTANSNARLLAGSVGGAIFLLLSLVIVGYGVPQVLKGLPLGNDFAAAFLRLVAQLGAIAGLVFVGSLLVGANPPKGIRGGFFIVISTILTVFFVVRAVGLNFDGAAGPIITLVVGLGMLYGAYHFLTRPQTISWMQDLEDQGWFSTHSYKRTQGLKLRRYTIMGILLLGLSGVWAMISTNSAGTGDLSMRLPFVEKSIVVLTDKQYTVPLLLTAATLWLAWRSVNVPTFADFLVATEAEMNKVSWTTRKRLLQDTVVVLVTTALITGFLLVIDLFWGWAISSLGILPTPAQKNTQQVQKADW